MILGVQEYPFFQYYQFQQLDPQQHLDEILAAVKASGLEAWEPALPETPSIPLWKERLERFGLKMPSAYLGGIFHEGDEQKLVDESLQRAAASRELGVRVIVCNPNPIAWGSAESKTDDQIRFQARVLEKIGRGLKAQNQILAYHTHDAEMRCGAREFYHMMNAINPAVMSFCLDVHWIYRGCGNSNLALQDILELYGHRIVSLHLRQSQKSIWTEYLQEGDVDYKPVAACLKEHAFSGPCILETAFEDQTPRHLPMDQSLRCSREWFEAAVS